MFPTPQWKLEFTWFPVSDMPELGEEWEDVSWHNDACPCFYNKDRNLYAWIGPTDKDLCDHSLDGERIQIVRGDSNGENTGYYNDGPIAEGDQWSDILAQLESPKREIEAIVNRWVKLLGIGFHPDNSADSLVGLNSDDLKEYDYDMNRLFNLCIGTEFDPYLEGLKAFERAKLI
jgi:hypothetical protein